MPTKWPRFIRFWGNGASSQGNGHQGFTFVEVMAAAALMAIVSLAIVAMFQGGIGAWEQGSSFIEAQRDLQLAADRFARQIQQAQGPITVTNNGQTVDIDQTATDNTNTHIYLEIEVKDGSLSLVRRKVQAGTTTEEDVWVSKLSSGRFEMLNGFRQETVKITLTRQATTQLVTVETVASRRL